MCRREGFGARPLASRTAARTASPPAAIRTSCLSSARAPQCWKAWVDSGGNRSVDIHGDYRLAGPEYAKRLAMRAKPRQMRPLPTRLPSQVLGWLSGSQESAGMCVSAEGQPQTSLGVEISKGNQGSCAHAKHPGQTRQPEPLSASQTHQQRTHATSHRSTVENRYQGIQ